MQELVDRELALFLSWYRGLAAEPVVEQLQKRAEKIRRREVESIKERFPQDTHEHLERLTRSLVRKLLHHPSRLLRSADPPDYRQLETARQLFRLDDPDE